MSSEQDPFTKLPKLNTSKDFIHWPRRVYAFIRRQDFELVGFADEPENVSNSAHKKWLEAMIKAKTCIVLSLGSSPLAQMSSIIDDDERTAKELWDSLAKLYTTSNAQAILNLENELETLQFQENDDWENHMDKFHDILGKLAAYDSPIKDEENPFKLLRTLPESFAPLAMVAQTNEMSLERLVVSIEGELSRRKNSRGPNEKNNGNMTAASASQVRGEPSASKWRSKGIQKGGKAVSCYICGRLAHYAKECWYRHDRQGSSFHRGTFRGRGFRGRSRGRGRYSGRGRNVLNYGMGRGNVYESFGQGPQVNAHGQLPNPSSGPPNSSPTQFYGFMAKLKFRSSIATCSEEKSHKTLIDSGGTHSFFHNKSYFIDYESIDTADVMSASGISITIGRGFVHLPLDGGMYVEAYHTPHFTANILSVGKLSKHFNIFFTADPPAINDKSTCFIFRRKSQHIVFKTEIDNGLYSIDIRNTKQITSPLVSSTSACLANRSQQEIKSVTDVALEWHNRLGHPSAKRYSELSSMFDEVPAFPLNVLWNVLCIPCSIAKAKRGPIETSSYRTYVPLQLIHVDILGPMPVPSLSGFKYTLGIVDDRTAKSHVFFLKEKSEFCSKIIEYQARAERTSGYRLQNIRLDGAGENKSQSLIDYSQMNGIRLECTPPYASQSNGVAERLMQELSLRARVLLFGSKLDDHLWAEAINHGNWLRNRLPSERIHGRIPILEWNNQTRISFKDLPSFCQPGFAFRYTSTTKPRKKLTARAVHSYFVGLHSDETLFRVFVPQLKNVLLVRKQDFRVFNEGNLPGVEVLLDGLSRQSQFESQNDNDGIAEEGLLHAFHALHVPLYSSSLLCFPTKLRDTRLPKSFDEALKSKLWCEAIDREYNGLKSRNVWRYVKPSEDMKPIPITWVFRLKPLDSEGKSFLHKARCCVRGDLQDPRFDFNPDSIYAPVASHESIRLLFAFASTQNLIVEGGDVSYAYLYGKIDIPIIIQQPTDSTGTETKPGHFCELLKSMYGLKQAGQIWGSLLCETLIGWGFKQSLIDVRVFYKKTGSEFIILVTVVDDMAFASNSSRLMGYFKSKLQATFDVKLFGSLKTFIGWDINQDKSGITVSQKRYTLELLSRHGLHKANGAWTPMSATANVTSASEADVLLNKKEHAKYRTTIGELLYLAVCTRPDISFSVSALARSLHAPTRRHMMLLKRVLRYLSSRRTVGILYPRGAGASLTWLEAYADSDWAGCRNTRQSTTGYIITFGRKPITWKSVRQTVVALSSAEAEYISMSSCAKDIVWIRNVIWEYIHLMPYRETLEMPPTFLFIDNTSAIALAERDQISAKSKHIEVKYHHIRDLTKRGLITLRYIPTGEQLADILTKPVERHVLEKHRLSLLKEE